MKQRDVLPRMAARGLACAVLLGGFGSAGAVPVFRWEDDWHVTLPGFVSVGSLNRTAANFGISATNDGQITDVGNGGDLGAASAFARLVVDVKSGFSVDSDTLGKLHFTRSFRLSDSPFGWDLSLSGLLAGFLFAGNLGLNSSASVLASATILEGDEDGAATGIGIYFGNALSRNGASGGATGFGALGGVQNSFYTVVGDLFVNARIDAAVFSGGSAAANFGDGSGGFAVTVDAAPRAVPVVPNIPAPAPADLLARNPEPFEPLFLISEEATSVPEPPVPALLAIAAVAWVASRRRRAAR